MRRLLFFLFLPALLAVRKERCVDVEKRIQCQYWKNAGYCQPDNKYSPYMAVSCNATCELCGPVENECNPQKQVSCLDGSPRCVSINKMCDGIRDCSDGHDEDDCDWLSEDQGDVRNNTASFTTTPALGDSPTGGSGVDNGSILIVQENLVTSPVSTAQQLGLGCGARMIGCRKAQKCIRADFYCDGWIDDCGDGEDEKPLFCYKRPNKMFLQDTFRSSLVNVSSFFNGLVEMKKTHCLPRHFSCKGACSSTPPSDPLMCACDPDCVARQDCCHDFTPECTSKITDTRERCVPGLFGSLSNASALMVNNCPLGAFPQNVQQCESDEHQPLDMFFGAPVYSSKTGLHYKNYPCAVCNDAPSSLTPWNVFCETGSKNCNSFIFSPPSSRVKTCTVHNFTDPILDNNYSRSREHEARKRCREIFAPVRYNNTDYRNPYCVYLHRSQVDDKDAKRLYTCDREELKQCPAGTTPCRPTFTCLDDSKRCDGVIDCPDQSDEPVDKCRAEKSCYGGFECRVTYQCISIHKRCDRFIDCQDQTDEEGCFEENADKQVKTNYDDIYHVIPGLEAFPVLSNTFKVVDKLEVVTGAAVELEVSKKKELQCVDPLLFDGIICQHSEPMKEHLERGSFRNLQPITRKTVTFTLSPTGYYRPVEMRDNLPEFMARHLRQHPYQVTDFRVENKDKGSMSGSITYRLISEKETSEGVEDFSPSTRDLENFVQIESEDEYTISEEGKLLLLESNQALSYDQFELRKDGEIMTCYETVNGNLQETGNDTDNSELTTRTCLAAFYAISLFLAMSCLVANLYNGRKTTVRILLINFTAALVITSLDSLLCVVSDRWANWGTALHLLGSLTALTWLLILSFHLLLSVSDSANPAQYFSVENLLLFHIIGWLAPTGWVTLFFGLNIAKVTEVAESLTNPTRILDGLTQTGEILHFPMYILYLASLILILLAIGAAKKARDKSAITRCRLRVKLMVLAMFLVSTPPWILAIATKYREYQAINITFCASLLAQAVVLVIFLFMLVKGDLETIEKPADKPTTTPGMELRPIVPLPPVPIFQMDNQQPGPSTAPDLPPKLHLPRGFPP
eukprot:sb/3461428/